MSDFRWLLFLDTNTSLEQFFTDINIPFDCQFLVAQPQSDHVIVLTEMYRVSPHFHCKHTVLVTGLLVAASTGKCKTST